MVENNGGTVRVEERNDLAYDATQHLLQIQRSVDGEVYTL
jgi:hypothetical protein